MCGFASMQKSIASDKSDTTRIKNEFIISSSSFYNHNVSLKYSHRVSEKYWLKAGIDINGEKTINPSDSYLEYSTDIVNIKTGILFGIDKHSKIKDDFEIINGFNLTFADNYYRNKNGTDIETDHFFEYGLGFNLGFYYQLSQHFSIGSELSPNIIVTHNKYEYSIINYLKFNLINISLFSIKYRY